MVRPEGNGEGGKGSAAKRPSRAERQATVDKMKRSAEAAVPEIDEILEKFDGRRTADHPDAFGAIPVETTVDGVIALAEADCVKTILEDQPILPPTTGSKR
jgi:hypothetical protein